MLSQIDKQIVRAWHHHLIAPRLAKLVGGRQDQSGPRIAVVGNCQSYGVAYAMKLLDPTARVDHFSAIGKSFTTVELFAKTMETYDHVFSHEFPPGHLRKGGVEDLRRRFSRLTIFPAVTFAAFQPDLVYLLDATRGQNPLNGPLRPYHSALAVFAYRIGLSLEQANALFNRNVYETVGYFDVWNSAAQEFLTYANNFGLDLSTEFTNWSRRGVFMYSIVHPKPYVLADLARRLFVKAGLAIRNQNLDDYAIDDLARS